MSAGRYQLFRPRMYTLTAQTQDADNQSGFETMKDSPVRVENMNDQSCRSRHDGRKCERPGTRDCCRVLCSSVSPVCWPTDGVRTKMRRLTPIRDSEQVHRYARERRVQQINDEQRCHCEVERATVRRPEPGMRGFALADWRQRWVRISHVMRL